jgi:predicted transcriptional regulator
MRTSIELSDGLVERARRLAKQKGMTLRAVVEEALDRLLRESEATSPFRLDAVTFGDGGLVADLTEVDDGDWESIRELAHLGQPRHPAGAPHPNVAPSADAANPDETVTDAARKGRRS